LPYSYPSSFDHDFPFLLPKENKQFDTQLQLKNPAHKGLSTSKIAQNFDEHNDWLLKNESVKNESGLAQPPDPLCDPP